jgi:oligopeptide transport system ATP-binding protein
VYSLANQKEVNERVENLLELVGLNPAFANRYPHEFSGGQRQRIGVARALPCNPLSLSVMSRFRHWMCRSKRKC